MTTPFEIVARAFPDGAPRLGFGTGDLYADGRSGDAEGLASAAFDAGFRYFDTARLYADGQAEGVVGRALQGRRDEAVIASKAGILPWSMRIGRRLAHKAGRLLGPLGRGMAGEPGAKFGAFSIGEMTASVEASLKALRTDYLDILLLHECALEDCRSEEVPAFLEGLVAAGKVRTFGIAATYGDTRAILDQADWRPAVVQAPCDAIGRQTRDYRLDPSQLLVTHSSLRPVMAAVSERVLADAQARMRFGETAGFDPADTGTLVLRLTAQALRANPQGVTLFSTLKADRLPPLRDALAAGQVTDEEIAALEAALAAI